MYKLGSVAGFETAYMARKAERLQELCEYVKKGDPRPL